MPIRIRECKPCDKVFEVFCRDTKGEYIHLETGATTDAPQCACGNRDLVKKVTRANVIWSGDEALPGSTYPYFDEHIVPGGMRIHNAAHHKRVMRRHNLVHITPQDIADSARAKSVAQRNIETANRAQRDREEHAPEYRGWRRMRASGEAVELAGVPKKHRAATQANLDRQAKEMSNGTS